MSELDAVVNAFGDFTNIANKAFLETTNHLCDLLDGSKTRLLVAGGAGSLYADESRSLRVMDAPDFPKAYLPTAIAMLEAYEVLIKRNATYTYLSPALFFEIDRPKTGRYKLGSDFVITNSNGESVIGYEDYAVAMVDEIENAKFIKQRFCVVEE